MTCSPGLGPLIARNVASRSLLIGTYEWTGGWSPLLRKEVFHRTSTQSGLLLVTG